jgi:pyrimidine operon attenuation protein/uracil phosphoribosyltransferase
VDEKKLSLPELQQRFVFAKKIARSLETISPIKVSLCEFKSTNKSTPIHTSYQKNMPIRFNLVDDVLNSGTTLIYVRHFRRSFEKFKTAVLVDEIKYPVNLSKEFTFHIM